MSALVIDLRVVRNTLEELDQLGQPEFRQQAINCVVAEVRAGRSGLAVPKHLWAERMRRTQKAGDDAQGSGA